MENIPRSGRVLLVTLAIYGLLVATHLGEFWPFSIYPMFSQGGKPWSRSIVHDVSDDPEAVRWEPRRQDELPGEPFPLIEHGVDPIDLANFVSKTKIWSDARVAGLRKMFGPSELRTRKLLVLRVNGRIDEHDSVRVQFVPYALLSDSSSILNDELPTVPDAAGSN